MKKGIIVAVIVAILVIGGLVTKVVMDQEAGKKTEDVVEATPSAEPQEQVKTEAPVVTEKPVETEEPTMTPVTTEEPKETPEVDHVKLSDGELIKQTISTIKSRHTSVQKMTEKERVVYSVECFNSSMEKGLHAYLTSGENTTATYLSDALAAVKANEINMLFNDFVGSYHIDLANTKELSHMKTEDYNFSMFDDEYKTMVKRGKLTTLLASYIRTNIKEFK